MSRLGLLALSQAQSEPFHAREPLVAVPDRRSRPMPERCPKVPATGRSWHPRNLGPALWSVDAGASLAAGCAFRLSVGSAAPAAADLAALAPGSLCFGRRPLVRGALRVRSAAALACDFALSFRRHRSKAASCPRFFVVHVTTPLCRDARKEGFLPIAVPPTW